MSSSQSYYEFKGDSTSIRVTPVTSYDPFEAKFCASLFWLVLMKTEDGSLENMPPQVTCPIERDAEQRITVRPEVIELLTNGDVYNSVCNSIFDNKQPIVGHWAIIQCLSRNGFYVVEDGDIPVTDSTLQQRKPFRKSTHLALMDGLMSAYTSKVVTIPQVVQAVRRFAPFNASKELPFDLEDALLLWLNKVCSTLNDKEISKQKRHAENLLRDQDKAKRFRFRRDQLQPKTQTLFPIIEDLLKGVSDGQCLLGVVLFYHTDSVNLEDIKFGQDLSQEDIVHNIELFRSLCSQYICTTSLSLQVEDFMYSSQAMKPNLVALLAEMFYKCELEDDTLTNDKKVRSKSATNITGFGHIDNGCTTRSSSAPMLASEIIAARSPLVGRKLKDFAKKKNQQRSNQQADNDNDEEKAARNSSQQKQSTSSDKSTRNYSMQLDFTDEDEISTDSKDKENPFNGIYRKPVLLNRKHSAPEPSSSGVSKVDPSFNRRAKQKQRTLTLGDWEMDEKDDIDIHVTDLQRSHSLTELDNKIIEPRKSFHAWHEETSSSDPYLDQNTMKSQRISLDFKPMKSHDRDIVIRPSLQRPERSHDDRVSQDSLLSSSPRSVDSLSSKQPRGLKQKENPVSQSTISEQDLKEFEQMEAIVLAQRSNDFNLNKSTEINDEDGLNTSVSSDDMNRFRLEVLQRLTADKIKSLEMENDQDAKVDAKVNSYQNADSRPETDQVGLNVPDEMPEELLSPINESSEPLLSMGSLPETRSSTPSTTPSSPCSPLDVAPFTPEFFMTSPANTLDKKAYKKAKQRQKDSSKHQSSHLEVMPSATPRLEDMSNPPRNKSVELLARGSYTMDQISIDAAKAAGIPVIGSDSIELRNASNQMRLSRNTVRSLSVPLDNDVVLQKRSIQDRPPSSSHSHLSLVFDDQIPLNERGMNSGSHPLVRDGRHFSSQQFDDVVIFDRQSSETFQGAVAHAPSNTGLPYTRNQSYHEPTRSSFVGRTNTNEDTDYNPYGGVNRHSFYGQKFVNEHEIDGSRSPRTHDPFREYRTRTSYIPTSTDNIQSYSNIPASYSNIPPSNELVNQSLRTSNQEMNSRYNNTNNSAAMSPYPGLHAYGGGGWGTNQESRVVYSDQYGTYVKDRKTELGYHGNNHAPSMYNQDDQDQSGPIHTQGQFATYHKDPRQTSMFRQSSTGHDVSANQITPSNVHCTVSSAMPLVSSHPNWEYQPNTSDVQTFVRSPNQQYTAYVEPGYRSPNVYSSSSNQHAMSPRHPPQYHEQVSPHQGYSPTKGPNPLSPHEIVQKQRNEVISSQSQLQERQHLSSLRIDGDERLKTPDRKSQAFTVDLDTGEFKEFNSSSETTSPRSPSSAILRSKTFRKGPEERVFEFDSKSLPGQQNKDKVYPQSSEGYPAVVHQKNENTPACLVNRTSWSESAEALKAVLYNGFPTTIKDNDVVSSSGVRTSSPRRTDKRSPGARVTWVTAGRNSFGGQVMLNEKDEIDESKDDAIEDDTTSPQHLALLSLHFEEKRRQIEAERQRSHEQWEEERRKIGETTFWYTIGRAQGNDKDAGKTVPRHENEPFSPGQPTPPIGRSTPFEGTSPLQNKPVYQSPIGDEYQSPINHTTIGHGYHQTFVNRPGHQPSAQSPVIPHTGFQFPSTHSPTYPPVSSNDYHGNHDYLGNQHGHRGDVRPEEQEYETRQFLLSEYAVQQDTSTSPSNQNEPTKSPVRKCWEVNPPSPSAVFAAASSTEGVALHLEETQGEDNGNQFEDPNDAHNKKGVALFIGEEAKVKHENENLQGLTPEQQRKRDRFLKNRQKKHEEEKIRRDAENEKKRLRELKQKEIEEQKRLEDEQKREEQRRIKQTRERMAASNGESTVRQVANVPEDNSGFNEFSGPRCYVKPSGKSNRKLITNAISHVCLSGTVNKENKEKCLQAIADSPGFHFIVLFKDGLKFRGLYMLNPETEQAFKVFGIGPKIITSKMVDCVYKYSSGGKEFTKIPSKTLSISVDGVAILKTYWQSNKPSVASKTQSNLKRPPRPPQR